jgi:hypothetical protein
MRRLLLILAILLGVALPGKAHSQQTDIIRGQVTGPDSAAIEGVQVTVTSISGNVSRTAKTDSRGRFTVTFPGGDGDYMVSYASLGYAAKRFEVKRSADEDVLVADARLTRIGAILDPVKVTAQRERPQRNAVTPDVGGTEQNLNNPAVPATFSAISLRWLHHFPVCNLFRERMVETTASPCSDSEPTRTTRLSTECSSADRTFRAMRQSAAR